MPAWMLVVAGVLLFVGGFGAGISYMTWLDASCKRWLEDKQAE
jgi:hypothetical protein